MLKRLVTVSLALILAFSLATLVSAQTKSKGTKDVPKGDRWEGTVTVVSAAKSTITVKQAVTGAEKIVEYDNATKWVSQAHGSKEVNNITANDVKEGDRVICIVTPGKGGALHATTISKRLTTAISH